MTGRSRTRNMVRRSLLVASAGGGLVLAGGSLASAAALPAPAVPRVATAGTGLPIVGGLADAVVGIITGTLYGISGHTGRGWLGRTGLPAVFARHARR